MIQFTCNPFQTEGKSQPLLETRNIEKPQATQQLYPSTYYQTKPMLTGPTLPRESNSSNFWLWLFIFVLGGFLILGIWTFIKSKLLVLEAETEINNKEDSEPK